VSIRSFVPANVRIHLIFPETRVIGLYILSLIVWVYLHSNLCSGLQKTHIICARVRFGRSKSSKVDDFGTNRKRVCDFLLVRHCDNVLPFIVSELRAYGDLLAKNCLFFLPLFYSAPSLSMFPLEFRAEVNHEETRSWGYPPVKTP